MRLWHSLLDWRTSCSSSNRASSSLSARDKLSNSVVKLIVHHTREVTRLADLLAVDKHAHFLADQFQRPVRNAALIGEVPDLVTVVIARTALLHRPLVVFPQTFQNPFLCERRLFDHALYDAFL
jgi:hypothetical protein